MLKNIIFDFGNVLCLFDPDYIARGFVDPDADPEGYRLFQKVVRRDWEGLDRGTVDYDAYIQESMEMLPGLPSWGCRRLFPGLVQTHAASSRNGGLSPGAAGGWDGHLPAL